MIIHRDNNSNAWSLDHIWATVGLYTVNSPKNLLNIYINVNFKPSGTRTGGNTGRDYSLLSLPLSLGSYLIRPFSIHIWVAWHAIYYDDILYTISDTTIKQPLFTALPPAVCQPWVFL